MSDMGKLAWRAGVGIDTARCSERHRQLAPRERRPPGYRRYGNSEVARLIRRANALGFSLAEGRELLALSSRRDVAQVKRWAQAKLASVDERLAICDALAELIHACPGEGRPEECPILHALGSEEGDTP